MINIIVIFVNKFSFDFINKIKNKANNRLNQTTQASFINNVKKLCTGCISHGFNNFFENSCIKIVKFQNQIQNGYLKNIFKDIVKSFILS